jgi:hypothetical protein
MVLLLPLLTKDRLRLVQVERLKLQPPQQVHDRCASSIGDTLQAHGRLKVDVTSDEIVMECAHMCL